MDLADVEDFWRAAGNLEYDGRDTAPFEPPGAGSRRGVRAGGACATVTLTRNSSEGQGRGPGMSAGKPMARSTRHIGNMRRPVATLFVAAVFLWPDPDVPDDRGDLGQRLRE